MPKPLTDEERRDVVIAIGQNMSDDDELPELVMERDFGGDQDAYLRAMAGWHHVLIGADRALEKLKEAVICPQPMVIDRGVVFCAIKDLDAEDICLLRQKVEALRQELFSRANEEIGQLQEGILAFRKAKGALFCFLEDYHFFQSQQIIKESAEARRFAFSQILAFLKMA